MQINFSYWWFLCLPIVLLSRMHKIWIFIFVLLSIHECMHIYVAYLLRYKTNKVIIYPIGLNAVIEHFEYRKSSYEILITLSGLSVHIVMFFLLRILFHYDLISFLFMEYLNRINASIFFFNLIPIYPLDGGRIFRNILEFYFPFKKAKQLSLFFSFLCLCIFIFCLYDIQSYYLIFIILSIQLFYYMYAYQSDVYSFYLYRFLYDKKGKIKIHDKKDIYKNKKNYIIEDDKLKTEKEYLAKYF